MPVASPAAHRKRTRKRPLSAWRIAYNAHIASAKWKAFRKIIFAYRGHVCEDCQTPDGPLHLHHTTYARMGGELPQDVRIVCKPCHAKHHPKKRVLQTKTPAKNFETTALSSLKVPRKPRKPRTEIGPTVGQRHPYSGVIRRKRNPWKSLI